MLKSTDFTLTTEEEQYLSDVIAGSTKGSMLSWLIHHPPGNLPDYVWDVDNLNTAPAQLAELIDHARRFHTVIHGAALVYNLLLARKAGRDDLIAEYEAGLDQWRTELQATAALRRLEPHGLVGDHPPAKSSPAADHQAVRRSMDRSHLRHDVDLANSKAAADLISTRERQIKGGRARLVNQSALDRWSGGSGLGRHDFRWTVARRHLQDLYSARAAS